MNNPDFVQAIGRPLIAHRLRRASDLFVEGIAQFLHQNGFSAPPRSVSTLLLLRKEGALGITEIAYRLKLSHPMIIKMTDALVAAGYAEPRADPKDNRRRLIALTASGLDQAKRLKRLLEASERAFERLYGEIGVDLFAAIERLEAAIEAYPVEQRLQQELVEEAPAEAAGK